jgi:hypothetical protein
MAAPEKHLQACFDASSGGYYLVVLAGNHNCCTKLTDMRTNCAANIVTVAKAAAARLS